MRRLIPFFLASIHNGFTRFATLAIVFFAIWNPYSCLSQGTLQAQEPLTLSTVDFVRDVRPIFENHCYGCHGKDKQKSGFRLDIKSRALHGGDNYGPL
ncbi:MAG: c-type cytochrome domain-containing protein, partial [Planctomycetota bacterium]